MRPPRLPPLNSLRAFAAAAEFGSFTKASESLHVTQGAVSRQVKQLEEWLGKALFDRTPQGIQLTQAGHKMAAAIDAAFGQIHAAIAELRQPGVRQELSINLPPTFATRWLAPRLSDFRRRYPGIDLSLMTSGARSMKELRPFDCAVVFSDRAWQPGDCRLLQLEQHVLVASPDSWVAGEPPHPGRSTLLHILDGHERMPVWEAWCAAQGLPDVDTRPGLTFSTQDQVITAAVSGAGLAIVDAAMIARELADGRLRRCNAVQMDGPHGYWFISLASDPEKRACVRLFSDWLDEQMAGAGGAGEG